jgi:hypothetical protein
MYRVIHSLSGILTVGTISVLPLLIASAIVQSATNAEVAIYAPQNELEKQAQDVLAKHCSRCHQQGRLESRQKPAKGFGDILQIDQIVKNPDRIKPGNPDGSAIFQQIVNKNMPYDVYQEGDQEHPRPQQDEIEILRNWIEKLGEVTAAACTSSQPLSYVAALDLMAADLAQQPEHSRKNVRYLTLTHLANTCASELELKVYRQGLIKLLNGLSQDPDVTKPETIDPQATIFRLNIEDLGWSIEVWEEIVSSYPYAFRPVNSQYDSVAATTSTKIPLARGDWFAFFASRPPLYEKILGLPPDFAQLQKKLELDVAANLARFDVNRAGFQKSGVSRNNRLIERHAIKTGAFWTSYDFAGNKTKQSLFQFPLGPGGEFGFQHDGGETIFNLPNGFQAYYLNDAAGKYLEKGPTAIVQDPERRDLAVTNGISCMGCHDQGMKNATDEIRAHVAAIKTFPLNVRETVKALYPEKTDMDRYIERDRTRFLSAMSAAGLDPTLNLGGTEMTNTLSNRYERDLDLNAAAAEFGEEPESFKRLLVAAGSVGSSLESRLTLGTVPRDQFEAEFGNLVEHILDATPIVSSVGAVTFASAKAAETESSVSSLRIDLVADKASYQVGEKPVFGVKTTEDCHLTLINVDGAGSGVVIFPNKFDQQNLIKANEDFRFPPADAKYDFQLGDRGTETVIAICDAQGFSLAVEHNFNVTDFTQLGKNEAVFRKIDVIKRSDESGQKTSGAARTAIKFVVK